MSDEPVIPEALVEACSRAPYWDVTDDQAAHVILEALAWRDENGEPWLVTREEMNAAYERGWGDAMRDAHPPQPSERDVYDAYQAGRFGHE